MSSSGKTYRALHYVLKIGNRKSAIEFFRDILGMKVLRHEEFEKGCEATCNGPYDGRWSKTMIGYGPEDNNFVLELTYNYGISSYRHGDALRAIEILKKDVSKLKTHGAKEEKSTDGNYLSMENNGYNFRIFQSPKGDQISRVRIVSDQPEDPKANDVVQAFYSGVLGMKKEGPDGPVDKEFWFEPDTFRLHVEPSKYPKVDHGTAFGRIAFACPTTDLPSIQKKVTDEEYAKGSILTPLISLDTPGKATVSVVIVGDPFGHEICFVGDEAFRQLSKVDPGADIALNKKIQDDKSDEWFAKHGKNKEVST